MHFLRTQQKYTDIDQSSNENVLADIPIFGDAERVLSTTRLLEKEKLSPRADSLKSW